MSKAVCGQPGTDIFLLSHQNTHTDDRGGHRGSGGRKVGGVGCVGLIVEGGE